uniref:Uncharacterized protein n=1 Tax=Opuntia streptacantha TaxID=393608 RepID=A0A7C8YR33_OPUST
MNKMGWVLNQGFGFRAVTVRFDFHYLGFLPLPALFFFFFFLLLLSSFVRPGRAESLVIRIGPASFCRSSSTFWLATWANGSKVSYPGCTVLLLRPRDYCFALPHTRHQPSSDAYRP